MKGFVTTLLNDQSCPVGEGTAAEKITRYTLPGGGSTAALIIASAAPPGEVQS